MQHTPISLLEWSTKVILMGVGLIIHVICVMTGAVSFVVKIFTEASASVASMALQATLGQVSPKYDP